MVAKFAACAVLFVIGILAVCALAEIMDTSAGSSTMMIDSNNNNMEDTLVKVVRYRERQQRHPIATLFGSTMFDMTTGGRRRTLEDYFRSYLSWLTPAQKVELQMLRNDGSSRDVLIQRVAEFFDGLPIG